MGKTDETKLTAESFFCSKSLYNTLFDELKECRIFTDKKRIIDCNLAALSLFEFEEKTDVVGHQFNRLFSAKPNNNQSEIDRLISEAELNGKAKGTIKCIKSTGGEFCGEFEISSLDNVGTSVFIVSILPVSKQNNQENSWLSGIFFQRILDTFQQPVFVKNDKFVYVNCNKAFANYIGKKREEIIGSVVFDITDAAQAEEYNNADIQLYTSGKDLVYETKVRLSDGQNRNAIFRRELIVTPDNEKVGIIGIVDDVTEFRKHQAELIENELKYKMIFENVQDVYYRTDLNGILTDISPSIKRYSKYIPEDIVGQNIDKFYNNPEDRNKIIQEVARKGEVNDYEVLLNANNGQMIWASVNAHFTFDENGQVNGLEGTLRDLTERKQSEDKLKRSLSLLQATLNSSNDAILSIDLSGKITSYNEQFKKLFFEAINTGFPENEDQIIAEILRQAKFPEKCLAMIEYLFNHPEEESFDILELIDGRKLERSSSPQRLDAIPIGRVWNFRDISDRKKAEQQLLLMAHTLKSVKEAVSITDTKNQILFANTAFSTIYGYTQDELVGKNISIVRVDEDQNELYHEILEQTLQKSWTGEILNRRKDGTIFPISLSSSAVQNENGETIALVGVATDITERKHFEEELQAKEAHLSTLIRTIPDLIWVKDINGVFLTCNRMFEDFLGEKAEEIIGKTDYDFVDKELADFFRSHDAKAIKIGKPSSNEEWVTFSSDGHKALLETIKTPMYDSKGNLIGVLGIGRDITARKNAEERLKQSEAKYRLLIQTMPDGVYRSTPAGKFVEVNDAMVQMLGYSGKEELLAIDIPTQLYFKPEDRDNLALHANPGALDIYPLKKKDGSAVWVEDHGWFVRDDKGEIIYHEGVTRNITDRRNAEIQLQKYSEELQELNATKDKYFSIIAHDLKSPFNSIIGLSEIIKNDAPDLEVSAISQYAGIINSTSVSTYQLLENLLDWARLQQSKMPFQPTALVLKTISNDVISLMIEKANSKFIAVINYIPEHIIITADKNMVETILRNLVSNALKFTSKNGKIELKAKETNFEIEISITDTGTGIKPEDIGKIFNASYNFTKKGTQNEKGTGLGLLLCKEFVERHNGRIWIESQVNIGSTFYFTISKNLPKD